MSVEPQFPVDRDGQRALRVRARPNPRSATPAGEAPDPPRQHEPKRQAEPAESGAAARGRVVSATVGTADVGRCVDMDAAYPYFGGVQTHISALHHPLASAMPNAMDPGRLFLENLPWIEKVAGVVCRKHRVWGEDAEDFASLAKMKLMENDYADIRMFRGDCQLTTYLATLVVRRFHEYARERWGRWRNSAAAEREGQLAKDLETLVHRDGCTLAQAGEQLRNAGKTGLSDAALARLLARLPARQPLRALEVGAPADAPAAERADSGIGGAELDRHRGALIAALFTVMEKLPPEERHILRMRFADGRSVADVARALRLEQKPLYRRIDQLRARIRHDLELSGVTAEDVRELLAE
jgi:RNA polymerase sigma factor for flagellar operon FliA